MPFAVSSFYKDRNVNSTGTELSQSSILCSTIEQTPLLCTLDLPATALVKVLD